jgi:hypothetical protein
MYTKNRHVLTSLSFSLDYIILRKDYERSSDMQKITKHGIFGDVLTEDNNIIKHIALYFSRKSKTTSQCYLVDIYSPMRQKMGYHEKERQRSLTIFG